MLGTSLPVDRYLVNFLNLISDDVCFEYHKHLTSSWSDQWWNLDFYLLWSRTINTDHNRKLDNFYWIRQTFMATLVYQIQQIDSLVTAACQIGWIGILLSSISDAPNAYSCNVATALFLIALFHFLLSNLLMVTGK